MKFFFDTEFIEKPCTIDLISIGMVCEDGREFYAESGDVDWTQASPWVLENVRPYVYTNDIVSPQPRIDIARDLLEFTREGVDFHNGTGEPEFWAYYADYDWVALCWLFGPMVDLPSFYPKFCMDLKQWNVQLGERRLPERKPMKYGGVELPEHHALADAHWLKSAWEWMDEYLASGDW